ncbi:DUF4259 domain-containing protein [Hymenobacter oligotrophus]|uniref:DUF4259 domain-containing protein n=1 Tax=Hymenobacter oligotrophus TaxID=2319843 RepID=A0A3B7R536_9BACT|nr:DUF4259 domain-containing protein [Hymenobacter oligotrophus]AYA36339.1 DUF4259 domain-containing protein [Hymenobacter oligotrophus]
MATWGHRNFDNDTAADFAGDFRKQPNEAMLLAALATVSEAEDDERIEAAEASEALAAAEIVAAILGKPTRDFPADVIPVIVKMNPGESEDLRELAQEAVEAVLRRSDLQAHWAKQGEAVEGWVQVQQDLLHRLQ